MAERPGELVGVADVGAGTVPDDVTVVADPDVEVVDGGAVVADVVDEVVGGALVGGAVVVGLAVVLVDDGFCEVEDRGTVVVGFTVVVVQCFHWGSPGRGGQCALARPAGMMTTVAASANAVAVFLITPQKV